MAISKTTVLELIKPVPGQERGRWGDHLNGNFDTLDLLVSLNRKRVVPWVATKLDAGTHYLFGFHEVLSSGVALVAAPVVVSPAISKVSVEVKAGTDLDGTLELSGDSRHKATGILTVGDTETLAIKGLGVYTSEKVWVGDVTITPSDVDISDADVLATSLFDNAGQPFEIDAVQLLATSTASGATLAAELKTFRPGPSGFTVVEELGGKLDIGPTLAGTQRWDLTCEPNISELGEGEGMLLSLILTGSSGDWSDIQFLLSYKVKPNTTV